MSRLDRFSSPSEKPPAALAKAGMEWSATVYCQVCQEEVEEQTLFPTEKVLVWTCSQGHESMIEGFSVF